MNITSMNNSTYKNRGMFLENILNDSNTYYNNIVSLSNNTVYKQ